MQQFSKISGVKIMPNNVAVRLADGTIISISDLPEHSTTRWVASNKSAVVRVFMAGLVSEVDILDRYQLSREEFQSWIKRYIAGGKNALKATKLQEHRLAN